MGREKTDEMNGVSRIPGTNIPWSTKTYEKAPKAEEKKPEAKDTRGGMQRTVDKRNENIRRVSGGE